MYTKYFGIATQTGDFPGHYYAFNYSDCQFVMAEIAAAGDEDPTYPFNNAQDQWLNATLLSWTSYGLPNFGISPGTLFCKWG